MSDLDADRAVDVRCDFTALPFRDNSFASCLFDPPYKLGNADQWESTDSGHDDVRARYGVHATTRLDVWQMIEQGLTECSRVTRKFLIVKCQDQIHNGFEWQTGEVIHMGQALGWRIKDMIHVNTSIPQPPGRQHHARRNYSTFVVLRR
jgi:tRNA G10  N-methylase Trm11